MTIDTAIRHTSKAGTNLFLELGFEPEEAKRLYAVSRNEINELGQIKEQLMDELAGWIKQHQLKQTEAAEILMVSRPRVSDLVNKKSSKFTVDMLIQLLGRIGKPVHFAVG